jgi:lysophospholipase L1-like esterase
MRIMAMGDSNTYGIIDSTNRESGGYRIKLDAKLATAGINADFVGSLSSGPSSDNQHEGYNGQTIDWLSLKAHQVVPVHKPDVILLMAGSNDLKTDSVATMKSDMSKLLDVLAKDAPNAVILVSTLPPPQPNNTAGQSAANADIFNDALPGIVAGKAAAGMKVKLVDTRSLTTSDMSPVGPDAGVHLNAQGYEKMANFWLNAITQVGGGDTGGSTTLPPPPPSTGGTSNPVLAVDDSYRIDASKDLWVNTKYLLLNDKGADGGLKITDVAAKSQFGFNVTFASDGTVHYDPADGWNGVDRIDYTLKDVDGSTDIGSIVVTVGTGVNTTPPPSGGTTTPPPPTGGTGTGNPVIAVDDTAYKPVAGKSFYFNTKYLTYNDKGADGGLKVIALDKVSSKGVTVSWAADGTAIYKAPVGYQGTDTLNYTLSDVDGSTDIGQVVFNVTLI